ncbi:ribosomal RNA large subunit methyltransferase F [Mesoterricola sediminis]|uniref:Ribosomal RNA large subunit methyltransferase F n=2 Tax=Mesoterricola sediminis TaxID=2927980 RepID=A0AA48KF45_9BACT|nr:23S rRNA (adenine(1618)-N(6))-methyltransferase RlmF [Mesoterricola sediminis]BDU77947.1 ribosomal RNA large subunit methyltransferase F [Mesoterricola sediminis]
MRKLQPPATRPGLHPANPHRAPYAFEALVAAVPSLGPHVRRNPAGLPTIDFADPTAVRLLNRALLATTYGVRDWDLPEGYLVPPVPGRADTIHHLAGLFAAPRGLRVLEIGVGAGLIHPILGHAAYGWTFVGTDVDPAALASCRAILAANPALAAAVELRLQRDPGRIFEGVTAPGEAFDLSLCNPPFHASAAEAAEGTRRKWRNLGRRPPQARNFGGQGAELWCPGGETAFVTRMAEESARQPGLCTWFSSLVSRSENLPALRAAVLRAGATRLRILDMAQGQKRSRLLAWGFDPPAAT